MKQRQILACSSVKSVCEHVHIQSIHANPPELFERLLTSFYKQKTFTIRMNDEILQKFNFYIIGVIQIF